MLNLFNLNPKSKKTTLVIINAYVLSLRQSIFNCCDILNFLKHRLCVFKIVRSVLQLVYYTCIVYTVRKVHHMVHRFRLAQKLID